MKIGELASRSDVTKRTIDYYTNLGLLEVERSVSNYRYYNESMIERIHWIEKQKELGKTLEEIHQILHLQQAVEVDVQELRLQMQILEQNVSKLIEQSSEQERQHIKKKVSLESVTLMQSIILLIS